GRQAPRERSGLRRRRGDRESLPAHDEARGGAVKAKLTARQKAVKVALDRVRARCDVAARREADPVAFVHRYDRRDDKEIVALVAASIAFGNVTTIRAKLE